MARIASAVRPPAVSRHVHERVKPPHNHLPAATDRAHETEPDPPDPPGLPDPPDLTGPTHLAYPTGTALPMAVLAASRLTANSSIQRPAKVVQRNGASGSIGATPCGHAALK